MCVVDSMLYHLSMINNFYFHYQWAFSNVEWMTENTQDSFQLNLMLILDRTQLQVFNLHFLFKTSEVFIASMIQQDHVFTVHSFSVLQIVSINYTVSFTSSNFNQWECFLIKSSATTFLKWQQEIDRMKALYQGNINSQWQFIISLLLNVSEQGQTFMKRILFTNLKIQTRKWTQANAATMSEWNPINILSFDCNHEVSKVNEQMKNKNCRSSVNKECECEKVRKHKHECEKNKEQRQDEKCEHEHKERNSSINIDDDDRESESYWFSSFIQLMLSVYSVNSQYTTVLKLCAVLQITWVKNFNDSKSETINTWEKMTFHCNSETYHLFN